MLSICQTHPLRFVICSIKEGHFHIFSTVLFQIQRMEVAVAVFQHQLDLIQLYVQYYEQHIRRRRRRRRRRQFWVRPWIGRRVEFGMYDQLMVELRNEDQKSFKNFLRMPPQMFDELLGRLGPRITKQHTSYRAPLEPGLKLALTLRHLASGNCYSSMQYGWRVPHNTQSLVVREVCQAIVDEYLPEVMNCPTTPEGWRPIAERFLNKWNFPHACGAIDGKHIACKCPAKSGSLYYNYKGFYSIVLLALVDSDYKFIWADIGSEGSASDAEIYNNSQLKQLTEDGALGLPPPDPLPNDNQVTFADIDFVLHMRYQFCKKLKVRNKTHTARSQFFVFVSSSTITCSKLLLLYFDLQKISSNY